MRMTQVHAWPGCEQPSSAATPERERRGARLAAWVVAVGVLWTLGYLLGYQIGRLL